MVQWVVVGFGAALLLHSGGGTGASATGQYRNLFAEAGHPAEQAAAKIDAAFQQLFHGDPNTQTVYYPAGSNANGPLAYLTDVANRDVRSEGMSYGMMIAVQMNKKAEFDALWNWAKTFMYRDQEGHPGRGYFSWSMNPNGTPRDEMPAPDGEEYFVMSLYFAAHRWGNDTGIYNYHAEADRILTDTVHRAVVTGPTRRGPKTAGPMFNVEQAMIRFTPDTNFTDPSYHLPAFYELWALWGPQEDRAFFAEAAATSRDFFVKVTNPTTGLAPDYANYDGSPRNFFQADSWRVAMNWSVDWSWWAKDPRQQTLSDRIQTFFESKGLDTYGNRYTLDGAQRDNSHSSGLVATNAVASLAATDRDRARKFIEALWNTPIPSGRYRYYDGMLYLMSMLHCSGQFRIWPPQEPASATKRD